MRVKQQPPRPQPRPTGSSATDLLPRLALRLRLALPCRIPMVLGVKDRGNHQALLPRRQRQEQPLLKTQWQWR